MRAGSWSSAAVVAAVALVGAAVPVETGAATSDTDISGEYIMVRRVTSDRGWFGLDVIDTTDNFVHEARTYDIVAIGGVTDGAAELSITSRYFGESEFLAGDPFDATFDAGVIAFENATYEACLSVATGEIDGPAEALLTSTLQVRESKIPGIFAGTFTYTAESVASDDCEAEDIGYTADAWLIRPDAAQAVAVPGVYAGQYIRDESLWQAEYWVRECVAGEGCELVVRYEQSVTAADGSTSDRLIDVFLSETGDGEYVGGATYSAGCMNDGVVVDEDAYDVRISAVAAFYDLGGGEQVMIFDKEEHVTPGEVTADVAAQCGAYTTGEVFAGLPIDREADWSTAAGN